MYDAFSVNGKKLEPDRACTFLCVHLWWKVKAVCWGRHESCASLFLIEVSRISAQPKKPWSLCVHLRLKDKAYYWGHELWDQTMLWNLCTIKAQRNEVHVPTASANDGSTSQHWSLSSFLQRLLTPLEYQPPVISIRTGVVNTWSLGENYPTLWLEWVFVSLLMPWHFKNW